MRRHELSDREWSIIKPLLPNKSRGVPRVDDRRVINGVLSGRLFSNGGLLSLQVFRGRNFNLNIENQRLQPARAS